MAFRNAPFEAQQGTRLVLVHAEVVAEIYFVAFIVGVVESHVGIERRQEPARDELESFVAGLQRVSMALAAARLAIAPNVTEAAKWKRFILP